MKTKLRVTAARLVSAVSVIVIVALGLPVQVASAQNSLVYGQVTKRIGPHDYAGPGPGVVKIFDSADNLVDMVSLNESGDFQFNSIPNSYGYLLTVDLADTEQPVDYEMDLDVFGDTYL